MNRFWTVFETYILWRTFTLHLFPSKKFYNVKHRGHCINDFWSLPTCVRVQKQKLVAQFLSLAYGLAFFCVGNLSRLVLGANANQASQFDLSRVKIHFWDRLLIIELLKKRLRPVICKKSKWSFQIQSEISESRFFCFRISAKVFGGDDGSGQNRVQQLRRRGRQVKTRNMGGGLTQR